MTYDAPLTEWISFALNKESLERTLKAVRDNKPIDHSSINKESNQKYLEKILREEVIKQFNDYKRPLLELVLNSIDARDKLSKKDYSIKISLKNKKFTVEDDGCSLDLEQILKFLVIPFNTEKDGIEDIGRFGVGFLSNFGYCIQEPRTKIKITAATKKEIYNITFYSTGRNVADLRMRLYKTNSKKTGTNVSISHLHYDPIETAKYLIHSIGHVPSYIANIYVNKTKINDNFNTEWYKEAVLLNIKGKTYRQFVGFSRSKEETKMNLTSQGVSVTGYHRKKGERGATVSFPAAIKLVEGRDEFKIDDNYQLCVEATFKAFESYIRNQKKTKENIEDLIDLSAEILAMFKIEDIKKIPNIETIRNYLFEGADYILAEETYDKIENFLGKDLFKIARRCSSMTIYHWSAYYNGINHFNDNILNPLTFNIKKIEYINNKRKEVIKETNKINVYDFKWNIKNKDFIVYPYHNLKALISIFYDKFITNISFIKNNMCGHSPFIIQKNTMNSDMLINLSHPLIKENTTDPLHLYAMINEFLNLPEIISQELGKSTQSERNRFQNFIGITNNEYSRHFKKA